MGHTENLVLIQKYFRFYEYVYNPLINTNRKHKILRDKAIEAIADLAKLFHVAVKSNQVSRMYEADAQISYVRTLLKMLVHVKKPDGYKDRRALTLKQLAVSESLLAECGAILGRMILNRKK